MGKGLEGVVAASTGISYIDGLNGRLFYRGIDINELAERSTFEETTALLWYGKLPNQQQMESFKRKFCREPPDPERGAGAADVAAEKDLANGGAAHRRLGALGLRPRGSRQLAGGQRPQVDPPDRLDADGCGRLGSHSQRPVADPAQHDAQPRGELSVYAHRQGARSEGGQGARHLPDPARRPRPERLDLLGADHRLDALRSALGDHVGDRHAERPAARRRERAGDGHAARDRPARPRGSVHSRRAERQEEDHGLRPPRLQGRRPARGLAPAALEGSGRRLRATRSGTRCPSVFACWCRNRSRCR